MLTAFGLKRLLPALTLFICAGVAAPMMTLADAPPEAKNDAATQPAAGDTKYFEHDGLRVWVTLAKPAFRVDEPWKLEVHFQNISDKPLQLLDIDGAHYVQCWTFRFKSPDKKEWRSWPRFPVAGLLMITKTAIDPGKTFTTPVEFPVDLYGTNIYASMLGEKKTPVKPEKMQFAIDIQQHADVNDPAPAIRYWIGHIVTTPVNFDITPKPVAM